MKDSLGTTVVIIALSLAVWACFYVITPTNPLTPPETIVVVGACAALVFGGKWVWGRLRRTSGKT